MIPTLFGITVVSFIIMQMAPGDPLMLQSGQGGSQNPQAREAYLMRKRELMLDKPTILNFNWFRDWSAQVRQTAYYLGHEPGVFEAELPELQLPETPDEVARLEYLQSLNIPDFEQRLADPERHAVLARTLPDMAKVAAENMGLNGVPAAVALLRDEQTPLPLQIGAIRALNSMVVDPFVYAYTNERYEQETAQVRATWGTWYERHRESLPEVSPQRRERLTELLAQMTAEQSRLELLGMLESLDRGDAPFFAEVLLEDDSTLEERVVSSQMLKLFIGSALETDVTRDASREEVNRVAANWLSYYELRQSQFEPGLGTKLWYVVGDTQYAHMVWRLVTFNFGRSALKTREPVGERIWRAVKVSAPLMIMAQLVTYLVAVPLGVLCAVYRGRFTDRAISLTLFLLYSIPAFVAGMLFLLFLCYGDYLKVFPMAALHSYEADEMGWGAWLLDYIWHAFLPVVCLSLFSLAAMAMYSRSAMLDVIGQDYVRTARAKGVPERKVILKHVLRNGLIPILTLFANFLPAMLGGSVLIEYLFNIPGMGRLSFNSIEQQDFPTLMALVYIDAIVVMVSILVTDLLYVLVDPRISYGRREVI